MMQWCEILKLSSLEAHRLFRSWRFWILIMSLLAVGTALPYKISVTITPSLTKRVFWINHNPEHVGHGDYVLFTFRNDAIAKIMGNSNKDMMKIIGCDEGEILTVDENKCFYCNGEYLVKAKDRSLKGEPLQQFDFNGEIPAGFMFVMGQHKDSYDSRYFGLIEKSRVIAKAYPLI